MGARTISFPKGKGSLRHNNRDFISSNVDESRTVLNEYFIQESLKEAYEKCFGQALADYNAKQTRKDRVKSDYINEIKNSGNGEKVFYENVVQIGDMFDTGIPKDGSALPEEVEKIIGILEEYVRTFQKRNPNLYLFNAVLHMDEATPHLHIDYIPVAHGYKKGLETRNSLTKALQQQGIQKAISKEKNETVFWQERERKYLKDLCAERGIEIYEKGEKRENLSLPEFKQAMAEISDLKEKAEEMRIENAGLLEEKEDIVLEATAAEQMRDELIKEAEEAEARIEKAEKAMEAVDSEVISHNTLQEKYLKLAEDALTDNPDKPVAQQIMSFGKPTGYVKVLESDWKKMLRIFRITSTKEKAVEQMAKDMAAKDSKIKYLTDTIDKCKSFLKQHNLYEAFMEHIKPKEHKRERVSLQDRLAKKKVIVASQDTFKRTQDQHKKQEIAI